MFKIQKTEYVNKTFRITKDLADRLSQTAQEQQVSMNGSWCSAVNTPYQTWVQKRMADKFILF